MLAAAAASLAALLATFRPSIRAGLTRARTWLLPSAAALATSGLSALVRASDASGTGTRTLYDWPKPFATHWQSWENAAASQGLSLLYFAANCAAHGAVWLTAWLLFALLRRRLFGVRESARRSSG